jgi:hypothetical protein
VLELKQSRRSALYGLTPPVSKPDPSSGNRSSRRQAAAVDKAARIVDAQRIQVAGGNQYYGEVSMNGQSFLVSERSPFKSKIDLDDLDEAGFAEYARICGSVLGQVHARSDEDTGVMRGQAENRILASVRPELFRCDIARFAQMAADRVIRDYRLFCKDHALGAFDFMNAMEQP